MNNEPDYDNLYFEEKKMIKVGQVYKVFNVKQVITHIEKTYGRYWWVSMINKNGSPSGMFCKKICLVINLSPNIQLGKKL